MLRGSRLKGIFETHIIIERVITRTYLILRHRVIKRSADLGLVGEELTQFERSGDGVVLLRIRRALHDTFLQSAEAIADISASHVHIAEIGELHLQASGGSPTAVVIALQQAQFIDPYLTRLHLAGDVAHTYHHHLHVANGGITHHADLVAWLVGVIAAEQLVETSAAQGLLGVAVLLHVGKHAQIDVEHILLWPYLTTVGIRVLIIIAAVRRQHQRNLVFVVVVLVVATQADKHRQLIVLQVCEVRHEVVGVDEHLHPFVLPQVERGILIDSLRLSMLHIPHHHIQGLLIVLHQLRLGGVCGTADAWRQHVVHRNLIIVLLDVDSAHGEGGGLCGRSVQALLIDTPLATHEVETSEAEHDRFLETRHKHSHEAHAGEVVDSALAPHVFCQRDTELIPVDTRRIAIAQFHAAGTHIRDEAVGRGRAVMIGIEDVW